MNTYEENLRESLSQTLGSLEDSAATLEHGQSLAQQALYHAKGSVLVAQDRLSLEQTRYTQRKRMQQAVQQSGWQAQTLLDTLSQVKQDSDSANGNVLTSANNLQASADALLQLASNIGAALNVASAAVYDSELYRQVVELNHHVNQIANQSRYLALQGMEVAGQCAESIAGALAEQGSDLQGRLIDLQTQTADELTQSAKASQDAEQQAGVAAAAEWTARAVLQQTTERSATMQRALRLAVRYANEDLSVEVLSAKEIRLVFAAHDQVSAQPAASGGDYLAIVPQSRAEQFNLDQAEQLFGQRDARVPTFVAVQPGSSTLPLQQDVYGSPIRPGIAYCAFLYWQRAEAEKRQRGAYSDQLSVASAPFVPRTALPPVWYAGRDDNPQRLLLAWTAAGQDAADGTQGDVAALIAASAQLEPSLQWLQSEGAQLDPATATLLDAVLPPFADNLQQACDALQNHDPIAADAANAVAQGLWQQLQTASATLSEDQEQQTRINTMRTLLGELALQLAQACASRANPGAPDTPQTELRCMLLDADLDPAQAAGNSQGILPTFFNLELAQQVAPANYLAAQRLDEPPAGIRPPVGLSGQPCHWYAITIDEDACDNFGNPLLPDHVYLPLVLATAPRTGDTAWGDSLSALATRWPTA